MDKMDLCGKGPAKGTCAGPGRDGLPVGNGNLFILTARAWHRRERESCKSNNWVRSIIVVAMSLVVYDFYFNFFFIVLLLL